MQSVTILPGRDKTGKPEPFQGITLERGELCTIVGNTGSGKSRFIKDVEQLAHGDSVTRRRVLLDGVEIPAERRQSLSSLLCDSPIVLIDEIENAGIDKERALGLLQRHDKLVLVVTHDPHTALMSRRRIVMGGGAVAAVVERSPQEAALYMELGELYRRQQTYQASLRRGDHLA